MILSLDTNVMIDIVNDRSGDVRRRFKAAQEAGDRLVTCAVAAHEFVYGAIISPRPEIHLPNAEALLGELEVEPWTIDDGYATARLRFALRRAGRTVGAADALIAGQALNRGWTVVSANLRDFERMEGLSVVDWRTGPESP